MTLAAEAASSSNAVLILAALLGIATVVVLITWLKVHPFLALILGSAVLGLVAGYGATPTVESFTKGVGSTVGSVGLLIALGAMIGGAARRLRRRGPDRADDRGAGLARHAALGDGRRRGAGRLPLFFEVGVVLLVPIVLLVAPAHRRAADEGRDPGARRPVRAARLRAAAPRARWSPSTRSAPTSASPSRSACWSRSRP